MREYISTESFSRKLRERAILSTEKKILISRLNGSEQEKDLTTPVNCEGYGRIRHFKLHRHTDWSPNPLPIIPAMKALGQNSRELLRAQVFQHAACNWRCWYCFVDFSLLSADPRLAKYFTADELIELFLSEADHPSVIDLTGGQPDITPEWVLWMMEAIQKRGLIGKIFLWSDDNLSNHYFWEFLNRNERKFIASFPKYSRVGCFKGYDEMSFAFNTHATPELFEQQFIIFRDLLKEGLDMYAYVTFTAMPHTDTYQRVCKFVDKLQEIHPNLPLRTVPLKVEAFTPTLGRLKQEHEVALVFQHEIHNIWVKEIHSRFSQADLSCAISDISLTK